MRFYAGEKSFVLDGKEFFLYSGEIHYFRIDAKLWEKHLKALKDAGCNAVSTYICWDWHEFEKGKYDFTGETHPQRNLLGYLELCKKMGIYCIVKPGPYILAEYDGHGIPIHLLREQKEILAVNEDGKIIDENTISLMNPQYLSAVDAWYDQIMPIIRKYQIDNGGPILMMQVCNEVGLLHWLLAQADFSPLVVKMYREYVEKKYKTVSEYNRICGEIFRNFKEVMPPTGDVKNLKHFAAYNEWHQFWRFYFCLYLKTLTRKIRAYGIKIQLTHNVAGWIYGGASEMPMILTFYDELMKSTPEISFGLDHIPEFMSFRNAHSDLPLNQILFAIQGRGPVWSAEFQAGTREHHVRNYAREMDLFYKASLAHDLTGLNFYMFSQGENPPQKGAFGKTFYWQTPLSVRGEKSALYDVVKGLGKFLKTHGTNLIGTEVKSELGVGFYKPYYHTELISSQIMARKKLDAQRAGLQYDPKFIRETVFHDGLLRSLQTLNFNYRIMDLQNVSIVQMSKFKQFWVVATEYMDEETQLKLSQWVKKGGQLVIYPCLPHLDCRMQPCTVLRDSLGIKSEKKSSSNKISVMGIPDLYAFSVEKEIYEFTDGEMIAKTVDGDACGIRKKVGKGNITVIGSAIIYNSDDHLMLFSKLIEKAGIKKDIEVDDPEVNVILRRGQGYAYLFVLNYHFKDKKVKITIPEKVLKEMKCRNSGRFDVRIPAVSAKILKLN